MNIDTNKQYKTRNGKFIAKFLRLKRRLPHATTGRVGRKPYLMFQLGTTDPSKLDAKGMPIMFIREHDRCDHEGPLARGVRDWDAHYRPGWYLEDGTSVMPKDDGLDLVEELPEEIADNTLDGA